MTQHPLKPFPVFSAREARPWRAPARAPASGFEALRGFDLFSYLSDEELRSFCARGCERRLVPESPWCPRDGDDAARLLVLTHGKAFAFWGGGQETFIGMLEAGDFAGHLEILEPGITATTTVRALEEARGMQWDREVLLNALAASPELARGLLEGMARQQARLQRRLAGVCNQRAPRRLARTLSGLLEDHGIRLKDAEGRRCLLLPDPPPRRMLGEMAGMARETVSRLLTQWEQCGWITEMQGDLVVRDEAQLRRLEGD